MIEKELINKIKLLKEIKPSKDWVVSVRAEILGEEENRLSWVETLRVFFRSPVVKPVFVTCLAVFVIFGTFNFTRNALPGNFLFPLKQLTERGKMIFASDKAGFQLEIANQRVEELTKIAKTGQKSGNLIVALQALNKDISTVSEQVKNAQPEQKQVLADKTSKLIRQTQAALIEMRKNGVEEADTALYQFIDSQIKYLETRALSDEQKALFEQAKKDFEIGNFEAALEEIWQVSNK